MCFVPIAIGGVGYFEEGAGGTGVVTTCFSLAHPPRINANRSTTGISLILFIIAARGAGRGFNN